MTVWPAAETVVGEAVLTTLMEATGMLRVCGVELTAGPDGGVPVATAVSTSAVDCRSVAVTL